MFLVMKSDALCSGVALSIPLGIKHKVSTCYWCILCDACSALLRAMRLKLWEIVGNLY